MSPLRIASMIPRVSLIEIRLPVPFHPVLTRYALAPLFSIFLTSSSAYFVGCSSKECLSEASGECRSWLCDSTLCTCKLSCKSRQEVVLCLLRCQNRYWRKYTECICRKEDNVLSCWCRRNQDERCSGYDRSDKIHEYSLLRSYLRNQSYHSHPRVTFSRRASRLIAL